MVDPDGRFYRTAPPPGQVTVTFTADINAVTDALLAIEAYDQRMYGENGYQLTRNVLGDLAAHNALGPIVLAMRAARDEAIADE